VRYRKGSTKESVGCNSPSDISDSAQTSGFCDFLDGAGAGKDTHTQQAGETDASAGTEFEIPDDEDRNDGVQEIEG
jgi:hypothetical protein